MKKAQSAVEFVILATFMFLFFAIMFIYVESILLDYTEGAKQAALDAMQKAVVKELDLAERMPVGYERIFYLPDTIEGNPYTLTLETDSPRQAAMVMTLQETSSVIYFTQNVTGPLDALNPGRNILKKTGSTTLTLVRG